MWLYSYRLICRLEYLNFLDIYFFKLSHGLSISASQTLFGEHEHNTRKVSVSPNPHRIALEPSLSHFNLTSLLHLDHQPFDLVLQAPDLSHQITSLVCGNRRSDNGPGHTASTTESHLAWDIDVGAVFVLCEEWKMQQNGQRTGVCGQNDDFGNAAIKGLCGFVCT